MAEYVHQTLEQMLPELEEMTHLELFTAKETKIILKNRQSFEYRLQQVTKTKAAFLTYIEYEKKLMELLKIRRRKVAQDSKKRELEKSISDRIHQLYRLVTTRFQDDVSLWQQHIDFSKAMNEKGYVSRLYGKVLKLHSRNESLWIAAARWEGSDEGNGNHEQAREMLLKAHRINPDSQNIFLEMYHTELRLAKQILKRKAALGILVEKKSTEANDENEESHAGAIKEVGMSSDDNVSEFKLVRIVYKKGIELFPGLAEFHMKILGVTTQFKEAKTLEADIVEDLQRIYPGSALVWNGLALRHLNGLRKMSPVQKSKALRCCLKTYKKAVEAVATEEMWTLCLRAHLAMMEMKYLKENPEQILKSALSMFQQAISASCLSEDLYVELLTLLGELGHLEDVGHVASRAVEQYPASPALWLARLQYWVKFGKDDEIVVKTLRTGLKKVPPEESWDMWELVLNELASRRSDMLEELMEKACRCMASQVCCPAKEWCLHWTFRQGGLKKARVAYQSLKTMRPISVPLYRLYIQIECSQKEPDLKLIRACFEEALAEFGLNEPDLWLNYMEMERTVAKDVSRSGLIQGRALRGLDKHLKETFIRKQIMMGLEA